LYKKLYLGGYFEMTFCPIYIALVHYPVYDRHRRLVATSITSIDVHDLARIAKTYGVLSYFVINPLDSQHYLAERISKYWQDGIGGEFNRSRKDAVDLVSVTSSIESAISIIKEKHNIEPVIISTTARRFKKLISFGECSKILSSQSSPCLFLFGTGYGLADKVINESNYVLEPIVGVSEYNHLPVRAAVAIILDRLLSNRI